MKRTSLKRKSKTPLAIAKTKLWKTLKQILEVRDGDVCISCGATGITGHNKHGGHFLPSASCGGFLRYDLRNVHSQCMRCNMFMSGATVDYMIALEKKYGRKFVDKILLQRGTDIKLDLDYITKLTEYYESLTGKDQAQLLKLTKNYNGFKIE